MKVAVICEFSGIIRDAFLARGHDAISCDLEPTLRPGPHLQGDCRSFDFSSYDLIIAHPPCTYLCNSGVQWLHKRKQYNQLLVAADFFLYLYNLGTRVCIENPLMHGYAKSLINIQYTQRIQPWQFGHCESKTTCLWLKNLPTLIPSLIVPKYLIKQSIHTMSRSASRSKKRSITYPGIAEAMAEQWGSLTADVKNV